MPLSCAGRSCPGRTAGRTSTGGSTCTTPSARWSLCSAAGGRKRSTPCGSCSMRGWWKSRNRAVENPTAFTRNPMKRFQTPTSRNPVMVRRRRVFILPYPFPSIVASKTLCTQNVRNIRVWTRRRRGCKMRPP